MANGGRANWCAIDTLLSGTFDTIGEDRDEAKRSGLVAWHLIEVGRFGHTEITNALKMLSADLKGRHYTGWDAAARAAGDFWGRLVRQFEPEVFEQQRQLGSVSICTS